MKRLNRFSAGGIHFALSLAIAAAIFLVVFFLWYPGDLFESAGGKRIFFLIIGVDVTLGPLITLVVFKPGKPGLKFDLWVIAVLQTAALAFGVWVLAESRPVYIVYVVDRFELMHANDYPPSELANARSSPYVHMPWGRPRVVASTMPAGDPKEADRILFLGPSGIDLQHMPQHYVEYESVLAEVRKHAKPIDVLRKLNPQEVARIDRLVQETSRSETALGFLPMRAGDADLAVIIDRSSGQILRMASLQPWSPR